MEHKYKNELYFDDIKNTYMVFNQREATKCGVYGVPFPEFKLDITGCKAQKQRVDLKFNPSYRPINKCFDGYFAFPSPMEKMFYKEGYNKRPPLVQEANGEYYNVDISKMRQELKSKYTHVPIQNFDVKDNREISYLNNPIFKSALNIEDKEKVIKLMNDKIKENKSSKIQTYDMKFENKSLKKNITKIKSDNKFKLFNNTLNEPNSFYVKKYEKNIRWLRNDNSKNDTQYIKKFHNKPVKSVPSQEKMFSYTFSDFTSLERKAKDFPSNPNTEFNDSRNFIINKFNKKDNFYDSFNFDNSVLNQFKKRGISERNLMTKTPIMTVSSTSDKKGNYFIFRQASKGNNRTKFRNPKQNI